MRSKRPAVTNPAKPADQYSSSNERIIEFSDAEVSAGGLISFRRVEGNDGRFTLHLHVYAYDADLIQVTTAPRPE